MTASVWALVIAAGAWCAVLILARYLLARHSRPRPLRRPVRTPPQLTAAEAEEAIRHLERQFRSEEGQP